MFLKGRTFSVIPALRLFLFAFLLFSCRSSRLSKELQLQEYGIPPGTMAIDRNVFIDKTEVTNFSYLEFLFWNKRVYGMTSQNYLELLPDTSLWESMGDEYLELKQFYFRHPVYRNYPVVNISRDQALKFSKWRSDRVMEFLLVKYGVMKYDPNPLPETIFTIENYFAGKYKNTLPSPYITYYPDYTLPDSAVFLRALKFSDSLYVLREELCNKPFCEEEIFTINCLQHIRDRNDSLIYGKDPINPTVCTECKMEFITHLQGNVMEFSNKKEMVFGGSFKDNCDNVFSTYFFVADSSANCYTGFRNVCRWRKW